MRLNYVWEFDDSYSYDVSVSDIRYALSEIIVNEYYKDVVTKDNRAKFIEKTSNMISDCDLEETYADIFEEELKDYFNNKAQREYYEQR